MSKKDDNLLFLSELLAGRLEKANYDQLVDINKLIRKYLKEPQPETTEIKADAILELQQRLKKLEDYDIGLMKTLHDGTWNLLGQVAERVKDLENPPDKGNPELYIDKCYGKLPLYARVAKALGKEPYWHVDAQQWLMKEGPPNYHDIRVKSYDTDLTLAMGALEEYKRKHQFFFSASMMTTSKEWRVCFSESDSDEMGLNDIVMYSTNSLPIAICEAIVKHKEEGR